MKKQMDLFDEGGLLDEGGTVDPESGNDVPVGSTQKEVRDDIPAQLSEGEFVLPADVVRYHGLEKIMELRDEAKYGLQKMEDMGQMGNSDEAILDDDVPFSMEDLELEDDGVAEYQVGGYVPPPGLAQQQSQFAGYTPQYQTYQAPAMPVSPYAAPQQQATPTRTGPAPTFSSMVQPTTVTYYDVNGNTIQVPVDANGNPLIPVPAGFSKTQPKAQTPVTPTTSTTTPTAQFNNDTNDNGPSPEEVKRQEAYRKTVDERMSAAEELGYTKKQSAIEPLMQMLVPGGALLASNPEVGTVLVDGTIADGQGNSFDPITGQQVGYKGGILGNIAGALGIQESEAEKFGLPKGSDVPEASLAGLRSQIGEQGIADVLTEAGTTPERLKELGLPSVGTAKVETTLGKTAVSEEAKAAKPTTVSQAAEVTIEPAFTKENVPSKMTAEAADALAERTGLERATVEIGRDLTPIEQKVISEPYTYTPRESSTSAEATPVSTRDLVSTAVRSSTRRDEPSQADTIASQMRDNSYDADYVADIKAGKYDSAFAQKERFDRDIVAAVQKEEENEIRMAKEERRSPNLSSRKAGVNEVSDSKGNVVRSSDGTAVKSSSPQSSAKGLAIAAEREQREAENSVDSRVICTELYRQGKLDKDLYRMDVVYTARHLPEAVVRGYHYWAIPTVPIIRKNKFVCDIFEYLTVKRAEEIAHIVDPVAYPKSTVSGKIIKNVGEAICHAIGIFVKQKDYSVLYKGKSV